MNPFPLFFVSYRESDRYWLIVEEQVTVTLPGNGLTRPTFKVTDEHRKKWPGEYAKFRESLSLRAKFRLWWWRKISKPGQKPVFDETQTTRFNEFVNIAIQPRIAHDKSVDTDIRAAIEHTRTR